MSLSIQAGCGFVAVPFAQTKKFKLCRDFITLTMFGLSFGFLYSQQFVFCKRQLRFCFLPLYFYSLLVVSISVISDHQPLFNSHMVFTIVLVIFFLLSDELFLIPQFQIVAILDTRNYYPLN